ncbi:unnamed protein product, partial [Staurois parvus]
MIGTSHRGLVQRSVFRHRGHRILMPRAPRECAQAGKRKDIYKGPF